MSHFYGTLKGQAGQVTRRGSKNSGLTTYAASWAGAVRVDVFERDGQDYVQVSMVPWRGITALAMSAVPLAKGANALGIFLQACGTKSHSRASAIC